MNDIQQRLRDNNPFASSSSPFPWENTNPDIQQLNREASEEIEQLIRQKRREPAVPLAGLILGERGSGKTHMMMRILRRLKENEQPAIFVAARAFRNPEGVMQHMLSEIFINLKLARSNDRSQFDMLMDGVVSAYNERRMNDGFDDPSSLDMRKYLARDIPRLDRNFLRCITLYLASDDDFVRSDILSWLCEGLDDDASAELGLPSKDTNLMTEPRREEVAEKTLLSLGLIMGYAKIPMIVCFDQLDNMKPHDLISAWGEVISLMMNDSSGILPLCFLRAETWEDIFRPSLDAAIVQRIQHRKVSMKGCSPAQARQLVRAKIAAVFGDETEEIYQWLMSRLEGTLSAGLSPRRVIELASEAVSGTKDPADMMRRAYSEEAGKVRATPQAWPPNADHLALALEAWLSSFEGFTLQKPAGKYIRVQGIRGDKKFAFVIVIPKSHVTATQGVNECMRFMKEYPGSFCCYVLEERAHKKTWKKFAEKLREFEQAGGFVARLNDETRITWYALTALANRVDNGDVNIYTASQPRTASRQDMNLFVRDLRLIDTKPLKFSPATVTSPSPAPKNEPKIYYDDKLFADTLRSILAASPVKLLTADKAAAILLQRGIKAGRNEVIAFVKNNPEHFRTYTSKSKDVLITLAEKP
ncbi:MAG: hypothetical protein IJP86_08440 [Synergistaceae bacterium]|nr:hypothetical protein [Synergistaceae bacterium]